MIFLEFWQNHGQSISHRLKRPLFRTLISAKDSPFSASFQPSSRGPGFYPKFDHIPTAISLKRGAILETDGFPAIFLKFWEIMGNLSPSEEVPFRTLIAAKDSPFSASFYPL